MEPYKCIFAILLDNNDKTYSFQGTGFFISNKGHFLSAAHVFKAGDFKQERFVGAFPSSLADIFKIRNLNTDYIEKVNQRGPVYRDLAYGSVEKNIDNILKLKEKRPSINARQKVIGFVNVRKTTNNNIFKLLNDNKLNLSDIQQDHPFITKVKSTTAIISENLKVYEKGENLVDNKKKYNNCFTLRLGTHHGVSGGPVLNGDDTVSGIYFGGPETHQLSHCIASKFAKKSIEIEL